MQSVKDLGLKRLGQINTKDFRSNIA